MWAAMQKTSALGLGVAAHILYGLHGDDARGAVRYQREGAGSLIGAKLLFPALRAAFARELMDRWKHSARSGRLQNASTPSQKERYQIAQACLKTA